MDGKYLLDKMDLIDPEYIEAADRKPVKKPIRWQQWTALAACITIGIISGVMMAFMPDGGTEIEMGTGETASIFSTGGVLLILLVASVLASLAISAAMIKGRRKK